MQRLIRTGVLKWARIEVWSHIHGRRRRHYPGLQLLVEHGYRLCDARGKELKAQAASPQYSGQERHSLSVDARNVSETLQGRDEVGEDCALSGRH